MIYSAFFLMFKLICAILLSFISMSSVTEIIPSIKLYPVYIDKIKTCAEGRRVALDIAIEDPEAFSMAMSLQKLGFEMTMDVCNYYFISTDN